MSKSIIKTHYKSVTAHVRENGLETDLSSSPRNQRLHTVGPKKQAIFCLSLRQLSTDFNAVFTADLEMNDKCDDMIHKVV